MDSLYKQSKVNNYTSCLRLFGAVPASINSPNADYTFLPEHGVVVLPGASHAVNAIKDYLRECALSGKQLNAAFHKSWQKIATASTLQLHLEQLLHYLSTYGMEQFGLDGSSMIYVPKEVFDCPEEVALKTIGAIDPKLATQQCLDLLGQKVALKPETIKDILLVLEDCGYRFTGKEKIGNREAACLVIDMMGVLPTQGDDLFRYLLYKATGSALVIKNPKADLAIKESGYQLPSLSYAQLIELAKSFNRHKSLWMAIKKAHPDNGRSVNMISRLSKQHHAPLTPSPLSLATSGKCDPETIATFAQSAPLSQVIRAINALRSYAATESRRYRIRNGKSWVATDRVRPVDQGLVNGLLAIVRQRINCDKVFYVPSHVDYALPTSEKQFLGNIPIGTTIAIPRSDEFLLVGVHWYNDEHGRVDLDLSSVSADGVIAWNTGLRTDDRSLMHSGDMTSAPRPDGAAEYLYAQRIGKPWLVKLHLFSGEENHPFSFRIGSGESVAKNYLIDPHKVLFEAPMTCLANEMILGVLEPTELGARFVLVGDAGSDRRLAFSTDLGKKRLRATLEQSETMVRLSEVVKITHDPMKADVDLCPKALRCDTLLRLIAG